MTLIKLVRFFPLFFFGENTYCYYTQVNKHIAKIDGVPVFNALWTCMDQHYIRAQVLTLTKAHEERAGPLMGVAHSVKKYGYDDPAIVFSDDPVKVSDIIQSLKSISDIEYIGQSPYLLCFSISQPKPYINGCGLWSECS
jgi:hypothetical protein